jgi:hypothetical protein
VQQETVNAAMFRGAQRLWTLYTQSLNRFPLITKTFTAGILFFVGDVICQGIEFFEAKKQETAQHSNSNGNSNPVKFSYDIKRSFRMAAFGLGFTGPFAHFFYRFIDKVRHNK